MTVVLGASGDAIPDFSVNMCSKAHEVVLFHFFPSPFGQNFPVTATPPLFEIKHLAVFFLIWNVFRCFLLVF